MNAPWSLGSIEDLANVSSIEIEGFRRANPELCTDCQLRYRFSATTPISGVGTHIDVSVRSAGCARRLVGVVLDAIPKILAVTIP